MKPATLAAFWLRSNVERRPFDKLVLNWKGHVKDDFGRQRNVHGLRPTTEATVLYDIEHVLRDTRAERIYIEGRQNYGSTRTLACVQRSANGYITIETYDVFFTGKP